MERVPKQKNEPFIQTFLEISYKNAAMEPYYVSVLRISTSHSLFPSYRIVISIILQILCPLFVRFCLKLKKMPHIKGNPGTTAGTVHHCPRRKISSYVKLGPRSMSIIMSSQPVPSGELADIVQKSL